MISLPKSEVENSALPDGIQEGSQTRVAINKVKHRQRSIPSRVTGVRWCVIMCANFLMFAACFSVSFAQTAVVPSGDGLSTSTAYQISELGHLVWMQENAGASAGKYYKLMNNIDASDTANWNDSATDTSILEGFKPIGTYSSPDTTSFRGIFDGGYFVITGLTINRPFTGEDVGFWGRIGSGGEVKNMGLVGGVMTGYDGNTGAVAGLNYGAITNCYASIAVRGNYNAGGLVGSNYGVTEDSYATGVVTGDSFVGGLAGTNGATIRRCHATGAVTGSGAWTSEVGGLAGYNDGWISNCYATGAVTSNESVGGLAGRNNGSISNCHATGVVTGSNYVRGSSSVGGFVGTNGNSVDGGFIMCCYATGIVTGVSHVGGLAGYNFYGTITNSYASRGAVTGSEKVGGLVGYCNYGTIMNCYATGGVTSSWDVGGGLVGNNFFCTISNCYWDVQSSHRISSAGGTGKSTTEMKQQRTFQPGGGTGPNDWDFTSIFGINQSKNNGYPFLRAFYAGVDVGPLVASLSINNDAVSTLERDVSVSNICTGTPLLYIASELPDFSDASWSSHVSTFSFLLSSGNGEKTIYYKVKDDNGESPLISDTILLDAAPLAPAVLSFSLNGGADETTSRSVTLDNACANEPSEYIASESSDFGDASWQPYPPSVLFTLSLGNGTKTVYFKTRNATGESNVASDSIVLSPPLPQAGVSCWALYD